MKLKKEECSNGTKTKLGMWSICIVTKKRGREGKANYWHSVIILMSKKKSCYLTIILTRWRITWKWGVVENHETMISSLYMGVVSKEKSNILTKKTLNDLTIWWSLSQYLLEPFPIMVKVPSRILLCQKRP